MYAGRRKVLGTLACLMLLSSFTGADPGTFVHLDCPTYAAAGVMQVNATLYQNGVPYACANAVALTITKPDGSVIAPTLSQCTDSTGLRQFQPVVASPTGTYRAQVNSPFGQWTETCETRRVSWSTPARVPEVPPALALLALGGFACLWGRGTRLAKGHGQ